MPGILVASSIALWLGLIVQALLLLALFRYVNLLLSRLPAQGPTLGRTAPRRAVQDIDGTTHLLGGGADRHNVLIFTSPSCPWCQKLAPDIVPFAGSLGADHDLLLVVGDELSATEARAYTDRLGTGRAVPLAIAPDLFESYAIPGTPYGVVIDKAGVVRGKGAANSLTDLQTLVGPGLSRS